LTEATLEEHNTVNGIPSIRNCESEEKSDADGKDDEPQDKDNEEEEDVDESQDSADRSVAFDQGYQQEPSSEESTLPQTRYEIRHWFTHVRKAESLWPSKEERDASEEWAILLAEMEKFVTNERIFNAWLQTYLGSIAWSPIHVAAHAGLVSLMEHLFSKGVDVMSLSQDGFTPLHLAVFADNKSEMLRLLLQHGAQPDFETEESLIPAFHYWILFGATGEDIQEFLKHKASCSLKNMPGLNVMHYFAWVGTNPEDLSLLLDHKGEDGDCADINVTDDTGETPLHKILSRRDIPLKLLQAFVDRGADVNTDDHDSQSKSEHLCIPEVNRRTNRAGRALYFLSRTNGRVGPLFQAGWEGELEAMKIIVDKFEKVEDIDDDDIYGRTVVHDAAWRGHLHVVKFLIEKGASPVRTDHHNRTPFLFACLGKSEETARFLLDKMIEQGATIEQINAPTKRNRTPLRQASSKGFLDIVQILLDKIDSPAVVNAVDTRKGRSALHCAAFRGKDKVVEALLEKGAKSTLKDGVDGQGKTALQLCHEEWAIQGNKYFEDTISLLIDNDPVAAAQDSLLLATAAVNGSKRILEMLHKAEADLDKIDQYGWTPLLLARQFQHTEAVEFLSRQTMPTKWDSKIEKIGLTEDATGIQYPRREPGVTTWENSEPEDRLCVVANRPISSGLNTYYYEVKILESAEGVLNP
jgi:ankyrin repeat protein